MLQHATRSEPGAINAIHASASRKPLTLGLAGDADRQAIYALRHRVYAAELGQHAVNSEQRLTDPLDAYNVYLVARQGQTIAGFISITPPPPELSPPEVIQTTWESSQPPGATPHGTPCCVRGVGRCEDTQHEVPCGVAPGFTTHYSIDKYVARAALPFVFDDRLFEVRLLTVMHPHRGWRVAMLLMIGAMEYVASRGGRRIVAIGRVEVLEMYRKVGLLPLGIRVRSGAVEYEVMTVTIQDLRRRAVVIRQMKLRAMRDTRIELPAPAPALPPACARRSREKSSAPNFTACYHGGAFFDAIGPRFDRLHRRHQIINADVLDAPFDPAPGVLAVLRDHLPWLLRTSPPTHCQGLMEAIADARGVSPANILPGGGSSDLIYLALRHWLSPASRVLILDPMYGEYSHVLEQVIGCKVDRLLLHARNHYDVDADALHETLDRQYDLAVLVNPNSPTGRYLSLDTLQSAILAAPARTRFWVDETYIDYVDAGSGAQSLERLAAGCERVVVCKSMSKVYALSGARVAYLCGAPGVIDPLRLITPPWAVSLPAQAAGVAALADPGYYRACYAQVTADREILAAGLRGQFGFDVVPGVANFLLCHLPPGSGSGGNTVAELVAACREHGLFLRDVSSMGSTLGGRALRIAVKDRDTNQRMIEILTRVLAK